ncbi:hypothetical protein THRCLA_20905 [Thraustotheca clavata]|uniref:Secreted protein n=1 Tax=Thraustotheca clavata TaxID=74557 RepID=A0A1W0A278_9STRA|nr:hypothetical protein THRCLA_20905 [Thraustotheca clavata]
MSKAISAVFVLLVWLNTALGDTCPSICTASSSTYIGFVKDSVGQAKCYCSNNTACDCYQDSPTIYCFTYVRMDDGTSGVLALGADELSGKCGVGSADCRCKSSATTTPTPTPSPSPSTTLPTTKPATTTSSPTPSVSPGTTAPEPTTGLTTDRPTSSIPNTTSPVPTTTSTSTTSTPTTNSTNSTYSGSSNKGSTNTPAATEAPSSSLQTWQIGLIIGSGVLILGVLITLCCLWRSNRERIEQHENIEEDEEFYRENYQTNKLRASSDMQPYHPSSSALSRSAARADSAPLAPINTTYADETYSAIINGNDLYSRRGSNGSGLVASNVTNPNPNEDTTARSLVKSNHPLVDV